MSLRGCFLRAFALALIPAQTLSGTPSSDPQAVAILTESLNASGAFGTVNPARDFTARGTIAYFWAGEKIEAPATIRARGPDQFRLDADLPQGTRSLVVSRQVGARRDADGRLTPLPYHNSMNVGVPTYPYPGVAAALADPTVSVSYLGLVEIGSQRLHQVRVTRTLPAAMDPEGLLSQFSRTDYFVDAQTYRVTKTADLTHPIETLTESYPRELELEDYTVMRGAAVPTLVREKVAGQTTWEFRLSSITFNTGLTDEDFSIPQ